METGEELKELAKRIRAARAQLTKHGISELYVYGKDERVGDELSAQRATFETVRKAGGKVFIACYAGAFELVGDLVGHANHSGPPNAEEAKKWHSVGHKVFNYGNPQSGVPLPEVLPAELRAGALEAGIRRGNGLGLLRNCWKRLE